MCNCNQKRRNYSSNPKTFKKGHVKVTLTSDKAIITRGNITGRRYVFNKKNDLLWVDERDISTFEGRDAFLILY